MDLQTITKNFILNKTKLDRNVLIVHKTNKSFSTPNTVLTCIFIFTMLEKVTVHILVNDATKCSEIKMNWSILTCVLIVVKLNRLKVFQITSYKNSKSILQILIIPRIHELFKESKRMNSFNFSAKLLVRMV